MAKKLTGQTLKFANPPLIVGSGSIVGPEETKGPLGDRFDLTVKDPKEGKKTWEKGERQMVSEVLEYTMGQAAVSSADIDFLLGGDLMNQIITSNYIARDYDIPYLGLYGACSTVIEALGLGSVLMDGGYADCVLAYSSSHYQSAERQYRKPLEYGIQYPPEKQWTVTGAGAYVLGWINGDLQISSCTWGKVIDLGEKDSNNLGAAMAPAAVDTILQHFQDLNRAPEYYDLVVTGDLARVGKDILLELLEEKNVKLGERHVDCGNIIFGDKKKYGAGGSGCAASATVLTADLLPRIKSGELNRILAVGTGSLQNSLIIKQNESIPGIAHAVEIEKAGGGK